MVIVLCENCKNYFGSLQCEAFPDRIPDEILLTGNPHTKPLPGQKNDIVFEPIEKDKENNS